MSHKLIGLYSPAPGSGKSTVARILQNHSSWQIVSFATPLKRMIASFLSSNGYGPDQIADLMGPDKEAVIPHLKLSTRQLMQTLGHEWGRTCVRPTVWTDMWIASVVRYAEQGVNVVVDDLRTGDEAEAIKNRGGEIWKIERPLAEIKFPHASEGGLDYYPDFDREISNDGDLTDLADKVLEAVQPIPV